MISSAAFTRRPASSKQNRLANQGLGYWTFEPGLLVSYLGEKNGFEATTYIGYDVNTKNTRTDYQSGQQFHIDVTVAQHLPLGKGLIGIGANGFYLQQTTGDSGSGARLGSFEEMTAGVGPVLSYAAQFGKIRFRGRSEVAAPDQHPEHTQRRLRLVQGGCPVLSCSSGQKYNVKERSSENLRKPINKKR